MFYITLTKLANKEKEDHKDDKDIRLKDFKNTLGVAGAVAGSNILAKRVRKGILPSSKVDGDEFYRLMQTMGDGVPGDIYETKDSSGKILTTIINAENYNKAFKANTASQVYRELDDPQYKTGKYRREVIGLGSKRVSPTLFLHELGHATGLGNKLKKNKILGNMYELSRSKQLGHVSHGLNIGATALTALAKDEKELSLASKANKLALGSALLNTAPELAEEARAWIRAAKFGDKYGVPINRPEALKLYSTYAIPALGKLAPPAINAYYIRKKKRNLKKKRIK